MGQGGISGGEPLENVYRGKAKCRDLVQRRGGSQQLEPSVMREKEKEEA